MKTLIFLFAFFVPIVLFAQAPPFFLRGAVMDMNSTKPLKGALAKVYREDGSLKDSLFTEADGVFDAFALTVGRKYLLVIELSGFVKASVEVDLNNIPDQVAQNMPGKHVDIQLIPLDSTKEKELMELEKIPNARFVYNAQSGKVDLDPEISKDYSKQMNFVLKGDSLAADNNANQEMPEEPVVVARKTLGPKKGNGLWWIIGVSLVLGLAGFWWWRKNK
jgi:hypothetical protein